MKEQDDGLRVSSLIPACCRQLLMGNTLDKAVAAVVPKDCHCPKAVAQSLWTLIVSRKLAVYDKAQQRHLLTPAGDRQARQA